MTKPKSGVTFNGSSPAGGECHLALCSEDSAGGKSRTALGKFCNVGGRRAATAADHVEPAISRPPDDFGSERIGRFRKTGFGKRVGQAGVRISAHISRGVVRQFLEERRHLVWSQGAVQPDHERSRVRGGVEKRFDRLSAQCSTGPICHRARDDQRHLASAFFESVRDREESSLRIQGVEDSFDEQKIDARPRVSRQSGRDSFV